ncbi:hypothetical protein PQX77_002876 [Marasmius sp. AFHP31]|nr:hypothetical protein PQX77_002876 [Marasmius sp. AFHP31]
MSCNCPDKNHVSSNKQGPPGIAMNSVGFGLDGIEDTTEPGLRVNSILWKSPFHPKFSYYASSDAEDDDDENVGIPVLEDIPEPDHPNQDNENDPDSDGSIPLLQDILDSKRSEDEPILGESNWSLENSNKEDEVVRHIPDSELEYMTAFSGYVDEYLPWYLEGAFSARDLGQNRKYICEFSLEDFYDTKANGTDKYSWVGEMRYLFGPAESDLRNFLYDSVTDKN